MKYVSALLMLLSFLNAQAQCKTSPVFPSFTGIEPLLNANDELVSNQIKYYYGAPVSLSGVKLSGGTLYVRGELTLNDLVFDSGTVFIHPLGKLIVNNAAGLIVKGNTRIYNAGTFQCLGNYVMDGTWATATSPNLFINIFSNSYFKMPNQYFLINNAHSYMVNNGIGDFHGIITDPLSARESICLGFNSQTRMRVLYNKARHPYIAPNGPACVSIEQYSQLHDTLTNFPTVNMCLGNAHYSDASCIPWGCKPNAWGAAQVTLGCANCASILTFLSVQFKWVQSEAWMNKNRITWDMEISDKGKFYLQHAYDGSDFQTIDSVLTNEPFVFLDRTYSVPVSYRILFSGTQKIFSEVMKVIPSGELETAFPNPFKDQVFIPSVLPGELPEITDALGKRCSNYSIVHRENGVNILFGTMPSGIYFVKVLKGNRMKVYKLLKQ